MDPDWSPASTKLPKRPISSKYLYRSRGHDGILSLPRVLHRFARYTALHADHVIADRKRANGVLFDDDDRLVAEFPERAIEARGHDLGKTKARLIDDQYLR